MQLKKKKIILHEFGQISGIGPDMSNPSWIIGERPFEFCGESEKTMKRSNFLCKMLYTMQAYSHGSYNNVR